MLAYFTVISEKLLTQAFIKIITIYVLSSMYPIKKTAQIFLSVCGWPNKQTDITTLKNHTSSGINIMTHGKNDSISTIYFEQQPRDMKIINTDNWEFH